MLFFLVGVQATASKPAASRLLQNGSIAFALEASA
jgi:hypothetical protein